MRYYKYVFFLTLILLLVTLNPIRCPADEFDREEESWVDSSESGSEDEVVSAKPQSTDEFDSQDESWVDSNSSPATPSTYEPNLLNKEVERGEEAQELGAETGQYNPDPEGLQKMKEEERVQDIGYEREHEFDAEKYRGYDREHYDKRYRK